MYHKIQPTKTTLHVNQSYVGETIEAKIRRMLNNKEPIKDGAPPIYSEREEGVLPETDIRTDKWDVALEARDQATRMKVANRELNLGEKTYDTMTPEEQTEFNKKYPKNKHATKKAQGGNNEGKA